MTHRSFKGGIRPFPNAGVVIRSDIGAVNGTERNLHRQSAGIALAAGPGMAHRAVAEIGQHFPLGNLLLTKNVMILFLQRRYF
ncbi:hypothetical protein D3C78_1735410 [compost metagenome]